MCQTRGPHVCWAAKIFVVCHMCQTRGPHVCWAAKIFAVCHMCQTQGSQHSVTEIDTPFKDGRKPSSLMAMPISGDDWVAKVGAAKNLETLESTRRYSG
ncbi:hypothetical protein AVEN_126573-1 [Araneus ventricosus]|uniref:Uncharacterized protein n=1 Tax=Araneus ventricosus TaxID=182803 RepID=A0A4Y2IAR8_ARAVE|nr:hypothetical protein AVEN_126573-1 [Araneus ventricosus]